MAGITRSQRKRAWNVHFVVGVGPVAGIYQRDDFLSVADVARELDLCLLFPQPEGDDNNDGNGDVACKWHNILLPIDSSRIDARYPPHDAPPALTIDSEPFIRLDETDTRAFPTPPPGHRTRYRYAFHAAACDNPRHHGPTGMLLGDPATPFRHPFPYADPCIRQAGAPTRRRDPRYLPIKTKCTDERLRMAPLRNPRKRKASSDSDPTPSSARSSSLVSSDVGSSGGRDDDDVVPVQIIPPDKARYMVDKFRTNVLTGGVKCAVTGKGESWLGLGIGGPGVEVAHIVPQCHWNTYPIGENQRVANRDVKQQLEQAWRLTWMESNGLPLLSHIHKCFEARLLAIHPTTYRIRTFAWYDLLNDYHGQIANISADVDPIALRHHWDMCCLENIVAESVTEAPEPSSQSPPDRVLPNVIAPPKIQPTTPPPAGSPSQPEAHGPSLSGTTGTQRSVEAGASVHQDHPLSPPSSDSVVQVTKWRVGDEVIADPKVAMRLRAFGWDVKEICALFPSGPTLQSCTRWRIGREVITDPEVATRLRTLGWELEALHKETDGTDEMRNRPRKRWRGPRWRIGAHMIEDESEAQRLRDQGWVVEDVLSDDDEENLNSVERSRPRKRRLVGEVLDEVDSR